MRIATYQAHNVKRLSDVQFDMTGRHLFLVGGRNAEGKTSVLEGLAMTLAGRKGCKFPERPLADGAKEGWVKIELEPDKGDELGKLSLELKFKRKRGSEAVAESFRVLDEEGAEVKKPREVLAKLYSLAGFDPLGFEKLKDKDQVKVLMELVGIDFSADEAKLTELFVERTVVNRRAKQLKAQYDACPLHTGIPKELISIKDLQAARVQLETANKVADELDKQADLAADAAHDAAVAKVEVADEITRLEAELKAKRAEFKQAEVSVKNADKAAKVAAEKAASAERADLSEIDQKMAEADEVNDKIRAMAARADVLKAQLAKEEEADRLTEDMERIRDEQAKQLKAAKWPVLGLSFDADRIYYEGIPFADRSRAERTLISFEIGACLNPGLRLFICEDGNDLDPERIQALENILATRDFQAVVEFVTRSDDDEALCGVVIEDGAEKVATADKEGE